MISVKKLIKKALFGTLYALRLDRCSWRRTFPPQVFFAHRVVVDMMNEPAGDLFQYISPQAVDKEFFVRRLVWLSRYWSFVPLDEAILSVNQTNSNRYTTLGFDDAYSDFDEVIQPVLQELGIPATFYITVNALDQKELLWFDKVYSAIAGASTDGVHLKALRNVWISLKSVEHKVSAAMRLCEILVHLNKALRHDALQELEDKVGKGPLKANELYLSRYDLADLAQKPGVTIGSHTMSHPNLLLLTESALREELEGSKTELENITGQEVKHLSYPNNLWDERISEMAKKCGYETAAATAKGIKGNLYALPRINIGWWNDAEFAVRTSRIWVR